MVSKRKAARHLGISESMVSRLINGERKASVDTMILLEERLQWSVYSQVDCRQRGIYGDRLVWWLERNGL